jgi:hypothetical protein
MIQLFLLIAGVLAVNRDLPALRLAFRVQSERGGAKSLPAPPGASCSRGVRSLEPMPTSLAGFSGISLRTKTLSVRASGREL